MVLGTWVCCPVLNGQCIPHVLAHTRGSKWFAIQSASQQCEGLAERKRRANPPYQRSKEIARHLHLCPLLII